MCSGAMLAVGFGSRCAVRTNQVFDKLYGYQFWHSRRSLTPGGRMASKKRPATRKSTGALARTVKPKASTAKNSTAAEHPPSGLDEFQSIFQDKKHELCELLRTQCEFIVECRVCKSLFRSVANFAQHKRSYCLEEAGAAKGAKRGSTAAATPLSRGAKARRVAADKKVASDELTRELEEAMLDMGEGGEEERQAAQEREREEMEAEEEEAIDELEPRERQEKRPVGKQRPWSTKSAVSTPADKAASGSGAAKLRKTMPSTSNKVDPPPVDQGNKCMHCGKIFMNRAGRVSHERYCANLTMRPLLGRGLAFADDYSADLPNPGGSDDAGPAPSTQGKSYAATKKAPPQTTTIPVVAPAAPVPGAPKQIVALPKGQIFQQRDENGVLQTYLLTTINGEQKAIPVKPAPAPPGAPTGTPGRAIVKVAVGAKVGSPVIMLPAGSALSKSGPSTPVANTPSPPPTPAPAPAATSKAVETPKPESPKQPQGPQAPIPNHLQPDLVKLLKEFSNVSGTVFFSMTELMKLNGDSQSANRLRQLIAALPPAGLIASKPISSGVLTKIVLSRPVEGEQGALKVVVIESGYTSQMRLRTKRDSDSPSLPNPPNIPRPVPVPEQAAEPEETEESTVGTENGAHEEEEHEGTEEAEDVKVNIVNKLFEGDQPLEEEEEENDEEKLKKAKMLLPPPKPVLRKMDLKMDKLLQSAVSKQVSKKKQVKDGEENANDPEPTPGTSGENETEDLGQEPMEEDGEGGDDMMDKLKTEQNDVTFKEMFAMPEEEEVADEEAYMKAAMILTGEESKASVEAGNNETEKNVRRSAFSRKK